MVGRRDFEENAIFFPPSPTRSALPGNEGKPAPRARKTSPPRAPAALPSTKTAGKTTGEKMRIDKFLKVSRVIKRRTVAAEACSGGRIEINGKPAKPAKEVKPGDTVTVSFGSNSLTFEVLNVDEKQTKQSASEMYRIID